MEHFAIHCTTCKARLIVKDESVIGDILSCPKCHSMVQVVPPPGWQGSTSKADDSTAGDSALGDSAGATGSEPQAPRDAASPQATTPERTAPSAPRNPARSVTPPPTPQQPASASGSRKRAAAVVPPALPMREGTGPVKPASAPAASEPAAAELGNSSNPADENQIAASDGQPAPSKAKSFAASARREWPLWSAGLAGGIALGALAWLVIWWQTPGANPTQLVAAKDHAAAAVAAEPVGAEKTSEVPRDEVPTPAEPGVEQPAPEPVVESPAEEPALAVEETPVATSPPTAEVPPSDDEAPSVDELAAAPEPALKLDPVAPEESVPAETDDEQPESASETAPDVSPTDPDTTTPPDHAAELTDNASAGEPSPLAAAEIEQRLAVPLARIDFSGVPLSHFAGFLSDISGARVVLDEPALAKAGKSRKTPVTVKLSGTTALGVLQAATQQAGLAYTIEPGRIVLSAPSR